MTPTLRDWLDETIYSGRDEPILTMEVLNYLR